MGKESVKIYNFNQDGDYELKEQLNRKHYVKNHGLEELLEKNGIQTEDFNKELCINPFLFQVAEARKTYVETVEDFYIKIDSSYLTLSTLLRSPVVKKTKKVKIIKKQFKKWDSENKERFKNIFDDSIKVLDIRKKNVFKKISSFKIFMLLIGIVVPIILLLNIIPFIDCSSKVHQVSGIALVLLSILGLVLSVIQNGKSKDYIKKINDHSAKHYKYQKKINSKYKRCYKKLYKYYKKGYKKNIFIKEPLPMRKIQYGGEQLYQLNQSTLEIQNQYEVLQKNQSNSKACYFFASLLSFMTSIISGGYLLFMILMYVLDILLKKGE